MSALACFAALLLFGFFMLARVRRLARRTAIKFLAETPEVFYPSRPATFLVSRYPSFAELDQPSYDDERRTGETAKDTTIASNQLEATLVSRRRAIPMDIRTFLQSRVPSLYQEFSPTWWLPSGHFQTAYVVMGDFSRVDTVDYER
jgi:hypothetical protein